MASDNLYKMAKALIDDDREKAKAFLSTHLNDVGSVIVGVDLSSIGGTGPEDISPETDTTT